MDFDDFFLFNWKLSQLSDSTICITDKNPKDEILQIHWWMLCFWAKNPVLKLEKIALTQNLETQAPSFERLGCSASYVLVS